MPAQHHRIAAILPLELEQSGRLLAGAIEYAKSHRRVTLVDVPYAVDAPNALRLRPSLHFDAAMVWATREAGWVERLLQAGIPVVAASGDWPVETIPCVSFEGKALVDLAVEHLASRRPAVIAFLEYRITGIGTKEDRARYFKNEVRRHGLQPEVGEIFRPGDPGDSAVARRLPFEGRAAKRLDAFIRALPRPAAVWCGDDMLGLRLCEAATALGLEIPGDIAVLGTGDSRIADVAKPPLSSTPLPGEAIGHRAFAVLDARLSGETGFPAYIGVTPPPVAARESTLGNIASDPLGRARAFISQHAGTAIGVGEVAAVVGLSRQALNTRFRERFGRSPGEEIRHARLSAAKRHLANPQLSIARVAGLCGFEQQSKFSDFFRRETGMSPRDWRTANGRVTRTRTAGSDQVKD
jgi:LacI family transcriptional regulator